MAPIRRDAPTRKRLMPCPIVVVLVVTSCAATPAPAASGLFPKCPAAAKAFRDAYATFLGGRGLDALLTLDGTRVRAAYGADAKLMESFIR